MNKPVIDDNILTFTIPFVALEPVTPHSEIFEQTIGYFNSAFDNAKDFEVDKIENTYWVVIDGKWCELGSNIIFARKAKGKES